MDLNILLENWYSTKKQIKQLEERLESYKKDIEQRMLTQGVKRLDSNMYTVQRCKCTRETLSKKNVPTDIWNKYSRMTTYDSYIVKKRN